MAKDAAEISPKLIDDEDLLPRDNSGGLDGREFRYVETWGDGGRVTGPKAHLSAGGSNGKKSGKDADGDLDLDAQKSVFRK